MKLESGDGELEKLEKGYTQIKKRLETMLNIPCPPRLIFSYKLLEKINAAQAPGWITTLMKNEDESARSYAQEKLNELKGLSVSDQFVIRMDSAKVEGAEKNMLSKFDLQSILESGWRYHKNPYSKINAFNQSRTTGIMPLSYCFILRKMNALRF